MPTQFWLAVLSMLITLIGTLCGLGYRDLIRRLARVEKQDRRLTAAMFTLLIAKSDDNQAIANALHEMLQNGGQ